MIWQWKRVVWRDLTLEIGNQTSTTNVVFANNVEDLKEHVHQKRGKLTTDVFWDSQIHTMRLIYIMRQKWNLTKKKYGDKEQLVRVQYDIYSWLEISHISISRWLGNYFCLDQVQLLQQFSAIGGCNLMVSRQYAFGSILMLQSDVRWNLIWLVVYLPLWNLWVRQLGWWNSQYMEK